MTPPQTFDQPLGAGRRPVLILIDMMRAYFTAGSPFDLDSTAALDGCVRLLDSARKARIPVVHTRVSYAADLSDGGLFVKKIPALAELTEGSALGRTMSELTPEADELVVIKQYASAFFGTSLAATLTARGVDTVVLAGVSTSGCVRASATDAIQHGFHPIVVAEACGDRTEQIHRANLADLAAKYADVWALAEMTEWLGN